MKIIAIVNCTATKTKAPSAGLRARKLGRNTLAAVVGEWRKRVKRTKTRVTARTLYAGRGFKSALKVATRLGVSLRVLSAGMGVVSLRRGIPSYSLTVTPGFRDYILAKTTDKDETTAQSWWRALTATDGVTSVRDVIRRDKSALIVLGVSSDYLEMISAELASLSERNLKRVRIVGLKDSTEVHEALRPLVMPYDKRLNGPDSQIRGTEFDFPQRALISFLQLVHNDRSIDTASEHARRVRLSLSQKRKPSKANRERVTDTALRRHIRDLKKEVSSISAGLKTLRRDYKVACEQSRFARLWA